MTKCSNFLLYSRKILTFKFSDLVEQNELFTALLIINEYDIKNCMGHGQTHKYTQNEIIIFTNVQQT